MNRKAITIGMDGSLFRYHPKLEGHMKAWLSKLAPDTQVNMQNRNFDCPFKHKLVFNLKTDLQGRLLVFWSVIKCYEYGDL